MAVQKCSLKPGSPQTQKPGHFPSPETQVCGHLKPVLLGLEDEQLVPVKLDVSCLFWHHLLHILSFLISVHSAVPVNNGGIHEIACLHHK